MTKKKKSEFEIVRDFDNMLGLVNQTNGTLFIYTPKKGKSTKPDGYYYYEGITFILDAKDEGGTFTGQLEDYMSFESNEHFVGFKYNGIDLECYVNGKLIKEEKTVKNKDYYKDKYFHTKINNEVIVEKSAKKLANSFRNAKIDKQMNVPFIGAVMLCIKYGKEIETTNTRTVLTSLKIGLNSIIPNDGPLERKQKREFIQTTLEDPTLKKAKIKDVFGILQEISTIYNFINISQVDLKGHDIMNSFLKIFRKWNSANANEKGEVFTPDHIAKLMYKITRCNKNSIILDPTCGSGTFLTNAMSYMWLEASTTEEKINIATNQIFGIEDNTFNSTLAGINMMLHGDGASHVYTADCFVKLPELANCYDRVLMNPPFSQSENELKFVLETLKYMTDGGYLSAIVPKSCVKGTDKKNLGYLKSIMEISDLISVISLPSDLFNPNAGVSTCILTLKKTNKKHSARTLLVNLNDDGYTLTKNYGRLDNNGNWNTHLTRVLDIFEKYYESDEKDSLDLDEKSAILKNITYKDEILFEAYSSYRPLVVSEDTFKRYIKEYTSAMILCGYEAEKIVFHNTYKLPDSVTLGKFKISDLLVKIRKGKVKSIDRKLEDKYASGGFPVIIAKKDNNGVGGMKDVPISEIYENKFCIISGGDGGGGKTYYCDFKFAPTGFVLVCDLKEKYQLQMDRFSKFYLSIIISERLHKTIGHGRTISEVPDIEVELPIDDLGELNIEYMKAYIQRIRYADLSFKFL